MALIFLLLERVKSGEPSRYLDHGRRIRTKFSTGISNQVSISKNGVYRPNRKSGPDTFVLYFNFCDFSQFSIYRLVGEFSVVGIL